jgi:glycosyltransferase involved in cell wall biosynthesis
MGKSDPLVSVSCITYNHAKYIRGALEGFVLQKTDFPIEIIIHDDASSDGTADIIREYERKYPSLMNAIYQKENQFSRGKAISATFVWPRCRGKYIAICEGDDYWTDPLKLQKQVDVLEANPEYGLVHTELDHFHTVTGEHVRNTWKTGGVYLQAGDIYDSLLIGKDSMIYACTACFRSEFVKNNEDYSKMIKQGFIMGDIPLWLHIASKSKIAYLSESTAVRNVLSYSATQGRGFARNLAFLQSIMKVIEYFNNIRPSKAKDIALIRYNLMIMDLCYRSRERMDLFESTYSLLDRNSKGYIVKIKRFGMKSDFTHLLTRLVLKVHSIFEMLVLRRMRKVFCV